ncbi:hypothetical protein HOG16_03670 [Candidatus Woesearchaeota archaeon]|jgi:hypothetical protein|nr:hypothetical protein [Candidatus Woesearchaeota archaeon]MBT4321621.1 hypothetical protein [Candidatus Woesearchaeota archaeon]MBT4631068.1 hypothetical protein [Candidatus Woesearchaeota archaeon]
MDEYKKETKYCMPSCKYASFPKMGTDGSMSCRTFQALWCNKLEKTVTKNSLCKAGLLEGKEEIF